MVKKNHTFICFLMFIVGLGRQIEFELFARVNLADMICIVSFPMTFMAIPSSLKRVSKFFLISILLYLLSSVVAGVSAGLPIDLLMKGVMKPLFITGYFYFFLYTISVHPKSLAFFILGGLFSSLYNFIFPGKWDDEMIGKGRYGDVVARLTPLISIITTPLLYISFKKSRILGGLISLVNPAVKMYLGAARSQILISSFPSIFFIFIGFGLFHKKKFIEKIKISSILKTSTLIVLMVFILAKGYMYIAPRGILGEEHRLKYEHQTSTVFGESIIGLMIAGRTPVYAAYLGVKENPVIGVGSWNRFATAEYMIMAAEDMGATADREQVYNSIYEGGGAGHSVFFQEWLEQGIGAAIFWIFAFISCSKLFVFVLQNDCVITPLYISGITAFYWSFFFSPLDAGTRLMVPLFLATYFIVTKPSCFQTKFFASFDYRNSWKEIISSREIPIDLDKRV